MFKIMRLENRLLFDAAAAPVALDAAIAHHAADASAAPTQNHAVDHHDASALQAALPQSILDLHVQPQSVNLLVVSSSVPDSQSIVDAAKGDVKTLYYDPAHTTLAQLQAKIADVLHGQQADSIAFVTEGTKGQIELTDGLIVNTQALQQNSGLHAFWQNVGSMIKSGGELNLLGCNIAQGTQGMTFLQALSQTIQHSDGQAISVNASIDSTGSLQEGGNWILEEGSSTPVDAASLYFDQAITNWDHLLLSPVASDDVYQIYENGTIFNNYNVGSNDAPGQNSIYILDSSPAHDAYFKFNTDGTFTYIADPYRQGTDTFTYHISSAEGISNTATVTIDVSALNNAPLPINSEVVIVPFNDADGVATNGIYSGLVNITITGVGIARGVQPNDAFYVFSNENDPGSYFRETTAPFHVFLIDGSQPNTSLPAPTSTHSYTFTVDVGAAHQLVLSQNDVIFTDNFGYYVVTISPVNTGIVETSNENAGAINISPWVSGLSVGLGAGGAHNPPTAINVLHFNIVGNTNPSLFSNLGISVQGDQASLFYTAAPNANGTAVISYTISDNNGTANGGSDTSPVQTFTIVINPVNSAPSFNGGANQVQNEAIVNTAYTVSNWATNINPGAADEAGQSLAFTVIGNSNPSLFSSAPTIDANGTLHYSIAAYAHGTATISLVLSDNGGTANGGQDTSGIYTFSITSNFVNQAPSFSGGASQTQNETVVDTAYSVSNWATNIYSGAPNETGQALAFTVIGNSNPSLFSAGPVIGTDGTLHYSIAAYAHGTATISLVLSDNGGTANGGQDTSGIYTFTITSNFVNQAPSFNGGASQTQNETAVDTTYSVSNWATNIYSGAPNETGQALAFTVIGNSNPSLFSAGPAIGTDGTLHYSIAAYAHGTATISLVLSDNGGTANGGQDTSGIYTFTITSNFVNQAPSFNGGASQTQNETAVDTAYSVSNWAANIYSGAPNETGQTLAFTVIGNSNPSLFSTAPTIGPDGTLHYSIAAYAFGDSTISVILTDNGGTANGGHDTSSVYTFTITSNFVNQTPTFDGGASQTQNETAVDTAYSVSNWAANIYSGAPNETGQTLAFTVIGISNPSLFSSAPTIDANGTLHYSIGAYEYGDSTISIVLTDNGGTANGGHDTSSIYTFTITSNFVNQVPSYTPGINQTTIEDSGPRTINWASNILAGPLASHESNQTVYFTLQNDNPSLFSVQPSLNSQGVLTYEVAPDASGIANITVIAQDDGGTAHGGIDQAATQSFTINVVGVRSQVVSDGPSGISGGNILTSEPDADNALTFTLIQGPQHATRFSLDPSGQFTYKPIPGYNGADGYTYQIADANGQVLETRTVDIAVANNFLPAPPNNVTPYVPPSTPDSSPNTNINSNNGSNGEAAAAKLFTEAYPSSSETSGLLHESIASQNTLLAPLQNTRFNEGRTVEANDLSLSSVELEVKQITLQEPEVENLPKAVMYEPQWDISSFARVPEMAIPTAAAFFFSVIHEGFTQGQSRITPIEKAGIAEEQESRILEERVRSAVGYQVILLESPKFAEQFTLSNTGIFTYHPKEGFKGEDSFTFQIVTQLGLVASVAKISIQVDDKALEKAKTRTAPPKYALKYGFAGKGGFTYQADLSFLGKDTFQYAHGDSMTKVQMEISPATSQLLTEKLLQEQKLVISSLHAADQTPVETSGDVKSLATAHMVQVSKQQFVENASGHFEQKTRSQFWQLAS